ncbi:hypothetical protein ACFXTI_016407 [Malus domestica]
MAAAAAVADCWKNLEYLSLVSKVFSELETHLSLGDKVVAEFVIDMGLKYQTADEFDAKLKENGVNLPDYTGRALLTAIHTILPPKPKAEKVSKKQSGSDCKNATKVMALDLNDNKRGDRDQQNEQRFSDEPELYRVYKGRVSRVMGSGCFVRLSGFRGKEGLVHVSQIANRRISNAKNVVRRDEEVYVKVISISGQKLSLSIRDVDQHTGKDLVPLKRKRSEEDDAPSTNPQGPRDGHGSRTGLSGIRIMDEDDAVPSRRRALKRMSFRRGGKRNS